ncbi:MAG: hypothetical protein SV775_00285 [Thermodesulfobacteriota bacterium]|nr:hypothetical protein [Thermodesulfobacteriota bacterium]
MSWNSTEKIQIRKFGLVAFIFFGCLCALGIWSKKPFPICLFGSLSFLGLGFILLPSRLRPVYAAWLKTAHLLGRIMTALLLTLAYYMVVTPSALLKRLFGGPPLPAGESKEKTSSYWVPRTESAQPRERFLKRY